MTEVATGVGEPKDGSGSTGKGFVKWPGLITTVLCCLAIALVMIYALIQLWPPPATGTTKAAVQLPDAHLLGFTIALTLDGRLFAIVALAGAIGGMLHALQSLTWYAGNRTLRRSWVLLISVMPVSGALAGVIFYIVLRAGLLSTSSSASDASPFGFAAVAALVGLFLAEALEKLKTVFATLFTSAPQGSDTTPALADAVRASSFAPTLGHVGDQITLLGTGLEGVVLVRFNGQATTPLSVAAKQVSVQVPAGATSGPIIVETPDVTVTFPGDFTVVSSQVISP